MTRPSPIQPRIAALYYSGSLSFTISACWYTGSVKKFTLSGVVKPFDGNGRKFGYPTANIEAKSDTPEGVFVGYVHLSGGRLPALIFVGAPITLNIETKRAEAHILDFEDRDLYGEKIAFEVESKLRDNAKFKNEQELLQQMKKDEIQGRNHFKGATK